MINNEKVRDIVGLLIGIVTVPMAISTLQWSNTTSDSITAAINVVNTYAFYQGKAAKWQIPDDVVFLDGIPLGATGKMQKSRLRETLKDYKLPDLR